MEVVVSERVEAVLKAKEAAATGAVWVVIGVVEGRCKGVVCMVVANVAVVADLWELRELRAAEAVVV